uniref:C-type lectin domain-containing protein n=1 Tax=Strongyloides stercoralis TaxID=6248 RepID=A0A913IBL3_STRER
MRSHVILLLVIFFNCYKGNNINKYNYFLSQNNKLKQNDLAQSLSPQPTCKERHKILHHDGMSGNGDRISTGTSKNCNKTFEFPIDSSIKNLYILIDSLGSGYPTGELFNQENVEVMPCSDQNIENYGYIASYCNVFDLNGGGTFQYSVSSFDNYPCSLSIFSETTIISDGGFINDLSDDDVQDEAPLGNDGIQKSPIIGQSSYFAFQMEGVNNSYGPQKITINTNIGEQFIYNVKERVNCSANYYIGPFICTTNGFNSLYLNGKDDYGYDFQRLYIFNCKSNLIPTIIPSSTLSPFPNECFNNGTLIISSPSSSYCSCTKYYTGRQCENKLCFNDGTLGPNNECICMNYWSGKFCQNMICSDLPDHHYDSNDKVFTFIIRTTSSIISYKETIIEIASNILSNYALNNSSDFVKYVIVGVANNEIVYINEFDHVNEFIEALRNLEFFKTNSCLESLETALLTALQINSLQIYTKSPIYIFSDGLSGDSQEVKGQLLNNIVFYQGPIFIFLLKSKTLDCYIDTSNEDYKNLFYIAQMSQGLVSRIDNESQAFNLVTKIGNFIYNIGTLLQNDFSDSCYYAPKYQTFFIDTSVSSFTFAISSNNAHFNIIDSSNRILIPYNEASIGDTKILFFNRTSIGNYELKFESSDVGPCQYRIYGRTNYELSFGTATKIIEDIDYRMPIYDNDYNLVAKINNLKYSNDTDDLIIESLIWTNDEETGKRKVLYSSDGKFRNGCSYHLFFGSWKCLKREMKFYINVIISNVMGDTIQRTKSGFCAAFNPTPIPPSGCQNGGTIVNEKNNTYCICSEGYTGNQCQQLICQNEGISKNGYCECRGGYTGTFCEKIECTDKNIYDNFPNEDKSLTFLLHESITTRTMINSLLEYSHQMIQDIINEKKDFISYYQLITFNNNSSKFYVDSTNSSDFINGLEDLQKIFMNNEDYSCNSLDLYDGIQKILFDPNTSRYSYFYVFINGIPSQKTSIFNEVKNFLELLSIQLNVIEINGAPCGYSLNNNPEMKSLLELVTSTKGSFYNIEPVLSGRILKTISSQYLSQLIYENYIEDCSTKPVTINFPIDSETETVTINIHGNLIDDPKYFSPPNYISSQFNYTSILNIYNDYAYGNRVDKIIKTCDNGWISYDGHCWLFVYSKVTWEEAKKSCNNDNANLVTIYNKDDKQFLDNYSQNIDFWIGLNDLQKNGSFVWDQKNSVSLPLTESSYVSWGPKQPNLSYQCVYNKNNYGWMTGNCLEERYYVCIKNPHNLEDESKNFNENKIPKGSWSINLQTVDGGCYVQITSQTNIHLFSTFSLNQYDDFGSPNPSKGNGIFNYALTHSTGLENILEPNNRGRLINFSLHPLNNMTLLGIGNITERDNCLYQHISTKFTCPLDNFKVLINGYDRFGYIFQRIIPVSCSNIVVRGECKNGGVPLANNCFCSYFWTGNNCDIIQCLYGKPDNTYQKCICNDGYTGEHCTIAVCTRKNGNNTSGLDDNNKAFILLLDGEMVGEMRNVLNNIEKLLEDILDDTNYIKKNKFTRFIGVVFRDSSYSSNNKISKVYDTTDKSYFITLIKNEIQKNSYQNVTSSYSRLILTATINALSSYSIPSLSQAYIITNSNAEDYNKIEDALNYIAYKYTKVDVIIIGDKNLPGNVSFNDNKIYSLFRIAHSSGGNFYQVPNYFSLIGFWNSLLVTEINTYTITKKHSTLCDNLMEYIQMGSKTTLLVLDIYSLTESTVQIFDPDNNEVKISGYVKTKTNWLILIRTPLSQLIPGVWKIKLSTNEKSNNFCHISARVLEDNPPHIAFNPDVGDDGGRHSDYSTQYTTASYEENAIVAETPFGILTYVQIHDLTGTKLLWASSLISREKCGFEYITKDLFTCTVPTFIVSINGIDDEGHSFRMIQTIQCNGYKNLQ